MLHIILDQFLGPENESGIIFSKIDTDRSTYRFSIDRCIDFEKIVQYSHVAYHFRSIFGSRERIRHYFFENRYRSINISIFDRSMSVSDECHWQWKKNVSSTCTLIRWASREVKYISHVRVGRRALLRKCRPAQQGPWVLTKKQRLPWATHWARSSRCVLHWKNICPSK